jgi:hypothetical protein
MLLGEKTHRRCVSNFKATIIDKAQFVAPSKKKKKKTEKTNIWLVVISLSKKQIYGKK